MADKSVSIDLIIKSSEAASSLKEVKQSLKDIKDEMIKAGEGTPAFLKLARAASELKDKVDDANDAIKAINPNKFQAVASFAASAAGGISAVTGAMGLFGEQSEEVTKTLAKVQSAMALSQGLASLSEMPKAWDAVKTALGLTTAVQQTKNIVDAEAVVVTEAQVVATTELEAVQKRQSIGTRIATGLQWLWNTAIMANPIGAIVIAVAALVAGLYLLAKAFSSSNAEQERQLKLTKDLGVATAEGAKNSAVERNNLEILYKTSTDQTKSLQERKDAQVELQKTYPLTFKNYTDEEFALGKAKIGFDNLSESVLALANMKAKQGLLDKKAMEFAEEQQQILNKINEIEKERLIDLKAGDTYKDMLKRGQLIDLRAEIKLKENQYNLDTKAIVGEIEGAKTKSKLAEDEKVAAAQAAKDKTDAEAKAKADAEKAAAAYKTRKEQEAKINEDFRVSELTAEQKSFDDFYNAQKVFLDNKNITKEEFDKRLVKRQDEIDAKKLEAAKKNEDEFLKIVEDASEELLESDKKYRKEKFDNLLTDQEKIISDSATSLELKLEALNIENEAIKLNQDLTDEQREKKIQDNEDRKVAITKAARQAEAKIAMDLAVTSIAGLQTLSDLAFASKLSKTKKGSEEEEKLMRKQFKANKAMQLSTAIINGVQAQLSILAQTPKVDFGIATAALMVGAGILSAASIAKIAATQFDTTSAGGGGGGMSTPDINASAATATSNSQPSTLLNPDGTVANNTTPTPAPIQVYVVESDITSTQTQVAVVQNQMNFH
jgi:hypothetical protein